jgi:hypothetical protein
LTSDGPSVAPHVREAVWAAVGRVALAVVSAASRVETEPVLSAAGLEAFDAVVAIGARDSPGRAVGQANQAEVKKCSRRPLDPRRSYFEVTVMPGLLPRHLSSSRQQRTA